MNTKQDKSLQIQLITLCEEKITTLPAGEIKYYLFILLHSIKEKIHQIPKKFLETLLSFVDNPDKPHQNSSSNLNFFNELIEQYNTLQTIAQLNTFSIQFKIILLHVIGALASLLCSIAGGLLGGLVSIIRGAWNYEPFKGLGIGLVTGYWLGAILGFRDPKKLFKDEFLRQIEFGLNGLYRCMENLQQTITPNHSENKSFKHYLNEEKILQQCFENNIQRFEQFLEENITYEINSFKAGFIGGSSLHGYLGHHFYIVIKIEKSEFLFEFTQAPADTGEKPDQQELRTVKGRKIIEMLALHNKLQETMPCTVGHVLKSMKPGDNDCQTFINKVLLGTNQPATTLSRYNDMNSVGSMIGFFIKNSVLSPRFF